MALEAADLSFSSFQGYAISPVAFLVLISAEMGLGAVLDRSLVDQFAAYGSAAGAGAIGLGANDFPMFPVNQAHYGRPLSGKGRGSPNSGVF